MNVKFELKQVGVLFYFLLLSNISLFADCNSVDNSHIEIEKHPNHIIVDVDKIRFFSILNYLSDMECHYRKVGSSNWINANKNCTQINIPGTESIMVCDFRLETDPGGVQYEYEVRVKCTLGGWGSWYRANVSSYCGPEGLETDPSSTQASSLTYHSTIAEEGRLSDDGGQTFFIIDQYQNNNLLFENLESNTQYWFKCRTRCDNNNEWSAFTPIKSTRTSCNEPRANDIVTFGADMGTHLGVRCERNANRYEFNMRQKGTSQWRTSSQIASDSYIFSENVDKGDIYEFKCRIECSGVWTGYSNIVEGMIPVQCNTPIPSEIGANQITNNSAHFFCRSGHGGGVIEKHTFRYREQSGGTWTEKRTDNTEVNVSQLKDKTNYVMEVQHECTNGVMSSWSNQINFITDQTCNVNNSAVRFANIGYTSLDLICDQENRDAYTWEVKRIRDDRKVNIPNPILTHIFTLSGLEQGEEYAVRLKVQCGTETSEWTPEKQVTTSFCIAPNDGEFNASSISNSQALFQFFGNTQSGLEWQYRKVGNTNWRKVNTTQQDVMVDSLVGNSEYEYRLRIKCSEFPLAYSIYSNIKQFYTNCNSKINRFSNITTSSITAHASDVGATQYMFSIMPEGGTRIEFNSNSPTYTFNQLTPGTNYEIQVKALCNGNGAWSLTAYAVTDEIVQMQCNAPTRGQLSRTNITSNSAELNCSKGNVDGFEFRYSSLNSGLIQSGLLSQGNFVARGLTPATIYGFQSRVMCGPNFSSWSDTVYFRTQSQVFSLATSCPAPYVQDILPTNIGVFSFNMLCLSDAEQYQFRYKDTSSLEWKELPALSLNRLFIDSLKQQTAYEFQCRLYCNGSFGAYSDSRYVITQSLTECVSSPIESFNAFNIKTHEANLISFNQARLYRFRYKALASETWITLDTSSSPNAKIDQLSPNTVYLYQIQTLCLNNKINTYSRSKYFKTLEVCEIDTANDVQVKILNETSIQFVILRPRFNHFFIRYREVGSKDWALVSSVNAGTAISVKQNTQYEWQALVYCSDKNNSQWSERKLFNTKTTSTFSESELDLNYYPNPGNGILFLELEQAMELNIYGVVGNKLMQFKLREGKQKLDLTHFPVGIYHLHLHGVKGKKSLRYVKL